MTAEERIAQLEAELARERARADGLQEIVHALTVKRRSSGAERQARYRERHAVTSDVTVTRHNPPPPLDGSPPPSVPSSPSPLSSPPPLSPSEGPVPAPASGEFTLTSPTSSRQRKQRTLSAGEQLYADLQQSRQGRCEEAGVPYIPDRWDNARQNRTLGPVAKDCPEAELLDGAWQLYLADEEHRAREPPWSLGYFFSGGVRAKYETRAAREGT